MFTTLIILNAFYYHTLLKPLDFIIICHYKSVFKKLLIAFILFSLIF
jgi:hypothetical protein